MAVRSKNRGGSTSVRGRVRSLHTPGSRRAYSLGSCAMGQTDRRDGQTDGSRYSKMSPIGRRHNKEISFCELTGSGARYRKQRVCTVCLSVRSCIWKNHMSKLCEISCTCWMWPWLGPSLTTMQHVIRALPVLWITSCFHVMASHANTAFSPNNSPGEVGKVWCLRLPC